MIQRASETAIGLDPTQEIYFDNNATTEALPEVIAAVSRTMQGGFGNPSSIHGAGVRARRLLSVARAQVANLLAAGEKQVVFTSGATEANNLVLQALLQSLKGHKLVTTVVEHSSILAMTDYLMSHGVLVTLLEVDRNGLVDVDTVLNAIEPGRTLVSIQWANSETGVLQPVEALAEAAHTRGALFHTDAVQAVGKVSITLADSCIDFLTLSGHKLHGPMGVGALVGPSLDQLAPLIRGGSQENGLRAGTENIPGVVGLGVALECRARHFAQARGKTESLRNQFEESLVRSGLVVDVNGGGAPRLPNTTNLRFASVDGEALTIRLDQAGIRCSQSSACTNQRPEPSYVLRAMGLSEEEAYASIRFGFSELNDADEVVAAVKAITRLHKSLTHFAVA